METAHSEYINALDNLIKLYAQSPSIGYFDFRRAVLELKLEEARLKYNEEFHNDIK